MNLAFSLMEKAARQGKLAHLLLFHGGGADTRKEAALRLAKTLNCQDKRFPPCETCNSCRKINSGNHPDVSILSPDRASIGIDQVLAWQEKVYRKHYEGIYKVFIVEQADKLTLPAANALLKVIEEPPEGTIIVLSAENAGTLLPTIQSRAQGIFFPHLKEEEWIHGIQPENPSDAIEAFQLSGGNPDLASSILGMGVETVRKWLERFWSGVYERDFSKLFALFPIEKEESSVYIQLIALNLEEKIKQGAVSPQTVYSANRALEALNRQATPRLVIEVLMLELCE